MAPSGLQYDEAGAPFVVWGSHRIQVDRSPDLDQRSRDLAAAELRETPENVEQGLQELRALLKGEPGLSVPLDDDQFLMKFLRPCKFYADSAFKKIQSYYKFRLAHAQYCRELVPSAVRLAFHHSVVSILSPRDQCGRRVMLVESGERWDPRAVPLPEVFRGVQLGLESAMAEPRTQVAGVVVLLDMRGMGLTHVLQFTPSFAKMIVDWIQDCIPIRLKEVHIINQPYIFNMLFAIFKPFLREKLRGRIVFHGSELGGLRARVSPAALRARHGGSLPEPEVSGDVQWQMLSHYEDSFQVANSFGYTKTSK